MNENNKDKEKKRKNYTPWESVNILISRWLDGSFTEISSETKLEGREAVLGVNAPALAGGGKPAGSSNPFMPKPPGMRRRPNAGPGGPR